jgi:hypothetical protein
MIDSLMRLVAAAICASVVLLSANFSMAQEPTKTPEQTTEQKDSAKPTERKESRVPS